MAEPFTMRAPCIRCAEPLGRIEHRNGQDCVFCSACDAWCYNAPRVETGKATRSVSTRPGITPGQRARIMETHGHACVSCGATAPAVVLHLDHLISREDAERHGFLDDIIDSEWNLAPMCEECNLGKRVLGSASVRLMYRCLLIKATPPT